MGVVVLWAGRVRVRVRVLHGSTLLDDGRLDMACAMWWVTGGLM